MQYQNNPSNSKQNVQAPSDIKFTISKNWCGVFIIQVSVSSHVPMLKSRIINKILEQIDHSLLSNYACTEIVINQFILILLSKKYNCKLSDE